MEGHPVTNPDLPQLPDLPLPADVGFDYLEDAKACLDEAHTHLSKVVAPGIDLLLAAAQANALVSIAESLEALLFDDVSLSLTAKADDLTPKEG